MDINSNDSTTPGSPTLSKQAVAATSTSTVQVTEESVECRSSTVELSSTNNDEITRVISRNDLLKSPQQESMENALMNVDIPPSSSDTEENIFMSTTKDISFAASSSPHNNHIDGQLKLDISAMQVSATSSRLDSPGEIISEEAVRKTMQLLQQDDQSDTGMGPGRIRKYATQAYLYLLNFDPNTNEWKEHEKHYFILSSAGKPIYSRYGDEDKLSTFMGVIQAIISVYQDLDDSIRSINACDYRFVFLTRGPLYFVVASRTGEPEAALRDELLWLYHQIVSIITSSQLSKIFEKHGNFDLRRLLGGTESFLDHLCSTVGYKPGYILGAIHSLKMDYSVRMAVGTALQNAKVFAKDGLLYGMLIVGESLVTLLRPKKHSFHPSDLHLILNMVNSSTSFRSVPESWMPICLPKYNDRGFLHAYVSFITPNYPPPANNLCLVLISNDRDNFFKMSECKKLIVDHLTSSGALFLLQEAIRGSSYPVNELNIPGLRHFLFKSKANIQYTMPILGEPYDKSPDEQKRLFILYQRVRNLMYRKNRLLKLCHYVTRYESIFAWITPTFELYANFSPLVTKPNVSSSINRLLAWVKKEEDSLFVTKAPTF